MVLPEHQGKGIGRRMLEMVMEYIQNNIQPGETAFVNLMAAGGKEPFYSKFGFIELPNGNYGHGMAQYITK
jgi:GNAT superfamily N-acetyltransferase